MKLNGHFKWELHKRRVVSDHILHIKTSHDLTCALILTLGVEKYTCGGQRGLGVQGTAEVFVVWCLLG